MTGPMENRPRNLLHFRDVLLLAGDNRPDDKPETIVDFDAKALNPTFNYEADNGKMHEKFEA